MKKLAICVPHSAQWKISIGYADPDRLTPNKEMPFFDDRELEYIDAGEIVYRFEIAGFTFQGMDTIYYISEAERDEFIALNDKRKAVKEAKKIAEMREVYRRVVARAKEQGGAMEPKAALRAQRKYNEMHNDGGFGYVPHFITIPELERAESWLASHPE